jgi:hypothetical protein
MNPESLRSLLNEEYHGDLILNEDHPNNMRLDTKEGFSGIWFNYRNLDTNKTSVYWRIDRFKFDGSKWVFDKGVMPIPLIPEHYVYSDISDVSRKEYILARHPLIKAILKQQERLPEIIKDMIWGKILMLAIQLNENF